MPKVVEVPDFGAIEFPDEMDDAQISSVLKQRFSPSAEPMVSVQDMQKQAGSFAAQEANKDAEILAKSNPLGSSKGVDITGGMVFDYDQGKAVPDVPYLIRQNNQRIQSEVDSLLTPYGAKFDNGNLIFNPDTRTKDYTPDEYAQALNRAKQITHDYVPEERVQEFANDSGLATAILGRFTGGLTSAAAGAVGIVSPDTARDMAGFAAQANQAAQDVPGVTGSVGRGIGNVATFAPLMTAGPGGIPGIIAAGGQAALQARSEAGFAREQEMRDRGATVEEVIQEEGQRAGRSAAVKSAIALPAYLAAGRLAAGATGRVMEGASRGAQVAGQTLTATGANVATGAGIRAIEGEQAIPNLEQLTTDALFGIIHGVSVRPEARKAAVEESVRRGVSPEEIATEPTSENFGFKPEEAPKTYYHGTKADAPFDQFSTSRYFNSPTGRRVERTPITFDSHGQIYFTPDYKYASEYSAPGTEVISANLDIQRPLDFTSLGADSVTNKQFDDFLAANGVEYTSRGSDRPVFERLQQGDLKKPAMKAGFDGMKLRESKADQAEALIAFDNSQVKRVPTQSGEPNLGPGAANAREFAERPRVKIAAYNDAVDAQRVQRGLEPLMSEVRKSDPEKWAAAEDAIELDPGLPTRVVEGINNGTKKSVSAEEQMAIQWRMIDLQNRKEMELERAVDPTNTPAAQEAARSQYEALELELQATESANRKAGSSSSDALRIRQLIANSDFTYSGMLRRRELAKGSPLDSTERATIKKQAETIERTQRELDLKVEEKQFGEPIDESIRAIEAEAAKNPEFTPEVRSLADRIVSRLDKAASSALQRLRSKFAQVNTGIDPTILSDMAIYGASKIAKGLLKFGQWSASMVKDFGEGVKPYLQDAWKSANERLDQEIAISPPKQREQVGEAVKKTKAAATTESIGAQMKARIADGDKLTDLRGYVRRLMEVTVRSGIKGRESVTDVVLETLKQADPSITRRQAMELMSGYGDFKPLNPDPIKAEVRDIAGQLQNVIKLEEIEAKRPLQKTGVERRTPSTAERALIAKVNEAKKKYGVVVTDPAKQLKSATDAIETRLSNQVKDLTREIETGEGRPVGSPAPTNERIQYLKALRDRVRETRDSLREGKDLTDAQRAEIAKRGVQRQIETLEQRLRTGERPDKSGQKLSNPELDALRARRDALRAEIEELDSVNQVISEESQFDALSKQASDLESKLAKGDISTRGRTQGPDTEMVSAARARLKAAQKELQERRKAKNPPKPEDERKLEAALKAVEKSIEEYDRRLQQGDLSAAQKKTGVTSPELEARRAERDAMRKFLSEMRNATKPRVALEERTVKALQKSIADLDQRLQTGDLSPKSRNPKVTNDEIEALRAERDAMQSQLDQMRRDAQPRLSPEERALKALKTRLAKDTADRLDRLARGDFGPRPKKLPIDLSKDPEAARLKADNERAKRDFEQGRIKEEFRRSSLAQKSLRFTKESLNLPRAILSSWDASAVLRQGGLISLGNPRRALTAIRDMFRGMSSQRKAEEMDAAIRLRKNAHMYEESGLYLAPLEEVRLSRQEEQIMSEFANKIPGIKVSNRAFITFLNRLRADSFDSLKASVEKNGVPFTKEEATAIANYINVATGRGNLGQAQQAASTLATIFFSPRLLTSRFQYLTRPLLGFRQGAPTSARVRKAVAWEYGKLITGLGVIYGLAQIMGAKVEKDPRSSDFGKIQIGNTRLDPLAGLAQVTTLLGRLTTGQTKGQKGIKPIRGDDVKYGADDAFDVFTRFLRTKFSPVMGAITDLSSGKNVVGEKVTPVQTAKNLLIPLGFRDIQAVMKEQGVTKGLAIELLNLFGWGMQNYSPRESK